MRTTPLGETYLGDGVYAIHGVEQIRLWTSDGLRETNIIYLEPEVYAALLRYVDAARQRLRKMAEESARARAEEGTK